MQAFKDMPIRRKLTLVILVSSGAAILLASALIIGYQVLSSRRAAVDDLHLIAEGISLSSAKALMTRSLDGAQRELDALETNPDILAARIFDKDRRLIAHYARPGSEVTPVWFEPKGEQHWVDGRCLMLSHTILSGNEPVGTLVLVQDRSLHQSRLHRSILVAALLMLATILLSMPVAARLQAVVTHPIVDLAAVARAVTAEKNYALRAMQDSQDETGQLVGAFNQMLDQIQERDKSLRVSEERFRRLAESITQVFWISNVEKTEMLYVSPAYEEIWGRTCESLYKAPMNWLEAIHPEDRERVRRAALSKQALGTYDAEYRVVQPSGAIRWIRDRAFPVRGPGGEILRLAGVADDITDRRYAEEAVRLQSEITRNMEEGVNLVRASDAVIVYTNPKFERMFGYGPGELVGQPAEILNARSVRSAQDIAREIIEALRRGGNWNAEVHNRKKDGTEFWCHANVSSFEHPEYGAVWISVHTDITDRKRAEMKLRQTEEKYRLLVERVPAVTYIAELGPKGRWHYISPQVERLLGFSVEEWMANPGIWARQIHPDDRAFATESDEQSYSTGKFSEEYRFIARDGRVVWCRDEGVLLRGTGGEPPVLQGVIYDITERKRAEQALRDSERRLQAIMDNSTTVVYLKDCHGKYLLINHQYESLFHVTRDQIVGKTDHDIFPVEQADRFRENDQRVLAEKKPVHFEEVAPHDDGLHTYVSVKFPFLDAAGEPFAVGGISTDITERKRAEQALLTQARVLENMVEGMLVYDEQDRILFTNHALDAMFGYGPGELTGQSTFVLNPVPAEECARIANEIRAHLQTEPSFQREFLNRRKDGSEFVSDSRVSRLQIDGQWCHVAVVQDITDRRRMEREILEVSDREQRRIGQDLHDGLCQLLTGTTFAIKTLEQKLERTGWAEAKEAGEISELLRRANAEARNIARGLHPVGIDAGGLAGALHELTFNVQSLFSVACRFQCEHPIALVDKAKALHAYRIAQEAVNNALKHSSAKHIDITLMQSNGTVTLTIDDDGVGLPEPVRQGAGMGLNIMAYRAKMIGGTVQVRRGVQRGTIVSLTFAI